MRPTFQSTSSTAVRLGLLLAVTAWTISHWQVFGATIGPFSAAAGPGGWEISRWKSATSNSMSLFAYSTAEETGAISAQPRLWGIFVYHWLVVGVLVYIGFMLTWIQDKHGQSAVPVTG